MRRRTGWFLSLLLGTVFMAAACSDSQKEATRAAINAAESAIDAAQQEAAKYAPAQLQAARATLQSAKDALAKSDYPAALAAAQDAANKAKDLAIAATSKKDQWSKQWAELSASVPKSLDQIKAKLNAYSHGAQLPPGLDQDQIEQAKKDYEQLKKAWADATASATSGNLRDAMDKVPSIQEMIAKLKELLGIKS
jgi:ATP-dependent Clp protease ATP-binding subunit ClpA